MQNLLPVFSIILCSLLLACHYNKIDHAQTVKQPDYKKAALLNLQLGMGYLKQGDRPRAKRKFLLAIQQEPHSSDVNAAIAYYYEQTNELEKANSYYLKAISLSSNAGAQLNNYGAFLCRKGEYKKAELYFMKAVADDQYINTAAAYENAGLCAEAESDSDKAKHYFEIALKQDPARKVSLYEWVQIESKQGNHDKALSLIKKNSETVLKDPIFLTLAQEIAKKTLKMNPHT